MVSSCHNPIGAGDLREGVPNSLPLPTFAYPYLHFPTPTSIALPLPFFMHDACIDNDLLYA